MVIIFDFIFIIIALIYLPVYLFKGKFHKGFSARFGRLPKDLNLDNPIWVHAVSVGEANAVKGLIEQLRMKYPQKKFYISTVTPTGNVIARSIAKNGDVVSYLPLDISWVARRVVAGVRPCLCIIAETELWPNLLLSLAKQAVPVAVVNGRISDRSYRGYRRLRFFLRPFMNTVAVYCVQTALDRDRLLQIGVAAEKISVCGNVKFDISAQNIAVDKGKRSQLGLGQQEKLLVAASTHPGEEEIIIREYQQLLKQFPILRLLIAPRHPQRSRQIEGLIERYGFQPALVSDLPTPSKNTAIYILDSVGQLMSYYSAADIVFVGGSLINKGGHNLIEPALFGKPIITGSDMHNFKDIAQLYKNARACVILDSRGQFGSAVAGFLSRPTQAWEMGQRARRVILDNRGATARTLEAIEKIWRST